MNNVFNNKFFTMFKMLISISIINLLGQFALTKNLYEIVLFTSPIIIYYHRIINLFSCENIYYERIYRDQILCSALYALYLKES